MPTIIGVLRVGELDTQNSGNYVVTIKPDNGDPGHGILTDQAGHSADWDSATGNDVDVLIFGRPPFLARQYQMTSSDLAHDVHDTLVRKSTQKRI